MRSRSLVVFVATVAFTFLGPAAVRSQTSLPLPTAAPRPPYPVMALAKKISGTVLVDVEVNVEGRVTKAEAISGPAILQDNAKAAARGFRFNSLPSGAGSFSVRLTFIFHDASFVPPVHKPDFTSPYQVEIVRPKEQF